MKDGVGPGEPAELSRLELCAAYVNFYRQLCKEVGPCRDAWLLSETAQHLLREPEPTDTFTVFRFYHAVSEGLDTLATDGRKYLLAFIKATELLETLCVNLFLQPWKKEIRSVKTFTGPFVYSLLPVLNSSTIKSVLAAIGYIGHGDTPSEFTLTEDANPDKAMQVGFELLLARVECYRFLELQEKDQGWMEVLQRKTHKPSEKQKAEPKEEERKNKEDANIKEIPLYSCPSAVPPQPRPRRRPVNTDQSLMEMQKTYPDLAFRGRPLVPDKPRQANSIRSSSKEVQTAKVTRASASTVCSEDDSSKPCDARTCGGPETTTGCTGELSGPQAAPEPVGWLQRQADAQNKNLIKAERSPLSSVEEEQDLRDLAHRMGQSHENKEEAKSRAAHNAGSENMTKDKHWKKDKKLRKPVTETGGALSLDAGRRTRSCQSDPTALQEQKQPSRCPLSHSAVLTAENAGQQGHDHPAGAEEPLAHSFVFVEPHTK